MSFTMSVSVCLLPCLYLYVFYHVCICMSFTMSVSVCLLPCLYLYVFYHVCICMSFTMSVSVCLLPCLYLYVFVLLYFCCFVLKYQSVKELLRAHVCHVDLYILLPTLNKIYLLTYLLFYRMMLHKTHN